MPDFTLSPRGAFGATPYSAEWPGFAIAEVTGLSIVSLAARHGQTGELAARVLAAYGSALPETGRQTEGEGATFIRMGADQWFMTTTEPTPSVAADRLAEAVAEAGSVTDQSDGWVVLSLSGDLTREVLEKICAVDLDEAAFPAGAVARTVMEHLGCVLTRSAEGAGYRLLSARSSARSLRHALEVAVGSTLAEAASLRRASHFDKNTPTDS